MLPISVLMCVYNREDYVSDAMESILNQTFHDFEFVVIVDGATDRTWEIVNSYALKDPRVIVLVNQQNMGITQSITRGLQECRGRYIARMDSDDISLPNRLQIQYDYLEAHPEIDVLGTGYDLIDKDGNKIGKYKVPSTDPLVLRYEMLYRCVLHNPTTLARSSFLRRFNEHHQEEPFEAAEDYAFWIRANFENCYANLEDRLLLTRNHEEQISTANISKQRESVLSIAHQSFEKILGKPISKDAVKAFYFSKQYNADNPANVRQGLQVMFQFHGMFIKTYKLSAYQKSRINEFFYERVISFVMKYKQISGVVLIGVFGLLRFLPGYFLRDIPSRFIKSRI